MNPVVAFVVVMLVWTISDFVAKKTQSLLSSLFVASIIFLIGFLSGIFPEDLLASSSLLALAGVVVGFIIVHLGTMISLDDFKKQWKTLLVGIATVVGIGIALLVAGWLFGPRITGSTADGYAQAIDFVVAGTGALSGGTISVLIVQDAALGVGLTNIAVFPVLIAALQGLIGFPLTSIILRREAARLRDEFRDGNLEPVVVAEEDASGSRLPDALSTTAGTLFVVGLVVLASLGINNLTNGVLNTFVVALVFGITLRTLGIFKPSVLSGIDALRPDDDLHHDPGVRAPRHHRARRRAALALPLLLVFVFGVAGIAGFAALVGKLLGYSVPMSVAIGLTALYGFPGTMILSQEAAKGAGESPEEVAAIEGQILPKMIVAGFSTVTITSVIVTSIIAGRIGTG